jgi:hypothetical protein
MKSFRRMGARARERESLRAMGVGAWWPAGGGGGGGAPLFIGGRRHQGGSCRG